MGLFAAEGLGLDPIQRIRGVGGTPARRRSSACLAPERGIRERYSCLAEASHIRARPLDSGPIQASMDLRSHVLLSPNHNVVEPVAGRGSWICNMPQHQGLLRMSRCGGDNTMIVLLHPFQAERMRE